MLAPLTAVPGCNCIEEAVSGASVGMVRVGQWVGVGVLVLMLGWVAVVDVGLGERRLGSMNSVGVGPLGKARARMVSVWVVLTIVVGVRACIVPPWRRCTGSSLATALGETASQRSAVLLGNC